MVKSHKQMNLYHFEQKLHYFSISSLLSHCEQSEMKFKAPRVEYLYISTLHFSSEEARNYAKTLCIKVIYSFMQSVLPGKVYFKAQKR